MADHRFCRLFFWNFSTNRRDNILFDRKNEFYIEESHRNEMNMLTWLYEIDLIRSTFEWIFSVSAGMQYPNERCWFKCSFCWGNHVKSRIENRTRDTMVVHSPLFNAIRNWMECGFLFYKNSSFIAAKKPRIFIGTRNEKKNR